MPTLNTSLPTAKRVPIPLNGDEIDTLQKLAASDQRPVSAMARIIYLAGLEQYAAKHIKNGRRK
jgi:hypothetical protein